MDVRLGPAAKEPSATGADDATHQAEPHAEVVREPLAIPGPAGARFVCAVLGAAGEAANSVAAKADMSIRVPHDYSSAEDALAPVIERYPWAVVAGLMTALGLTIGVAWVGLSRLWKPKAAAPGADVQPEPVAYAPRERGSWSPL